MGMVSIVLCLIYFIFFIFPEIYGVTFEIIDVDNK